MNKEEMQKLEEKTAVKMGSVARNEIKNRTQAMDEKELQITVKNIPSNILWDELRKRFDIKSEMVRQVRAAVMVTVDDIDEME